MDGGWEYYLHGCAWVSKISVDIDSWAAVDGSAYPGTASRMTRGRWM